MSEKHVAIIHINDSMLLGMDFPPHVDLYLLTILDLWIVSPPVEPGLESAHCICW